MSQIDFDKGNKVTGKRYSYTEWSYDEFFDDFIQTLKGMSGEDQRKFFRNASETGLIEVRNYVLYRYKEFYINLTSPNTGEKFVKDHEIANGLQLTTFPQLIEHFTTGSNMIIVTKIPGNTGKNIIDQPSYSIANIKNEVSDFAKQSVIRELKVLESHGYLIDPKFRYCVRMNDDGRIIIPHFPLISVEEVKSRANDRFLKEIYGRYGMFGNYSE